MDLDDGVTLRASDDPTIKNELRRAWIADRLDERLGEFGETHAVDVVCATSRRRRRAHVASLHARGPRVRVPAAPHWVRRKQHLAVGF